MRYPSTLISRFGSIDAFVEAAALHVEAPRAKLTPAAVSMWKSRDNVPFMWRPVIRDMAGRLLPSEAPQ